MSSCGYSCILCGHLICSTLPAAWLREYRASESPSAGRSSPAADLWSLWQTSGAVHHRCWVLWWKRIMEGSVWSGWTMGSKPTAKCTGDPSHATAIIRRTARLCSSWCVLASPEESLRAWTHPSWTTVDNVWIITVSAAHAWCLLGPRLRPASRTRHSKSLSLAGAISSTIRENLRFLHPGKPFWDTWSCWNHIESHCPSSGQESIDTGSGLFLPAALGNPRDYRYPIAYKWCAETASCVQIIPGSLF